MFSYYGSKSKIVDYYPAPKHKKIIEPFAGSARYALKYWQNDITLVDKYDVIIRTWKWLQQCSLNDIKKLPVLKLGESLNDYNLSKNEKMFLSFIVQKGTPGMNKTVSSFAASDIDARINKVAEQLYKIRHWNIIHGSYDDLENEKATWFIDPPYQFGGKRYKHGSKDLDFNRLGEWCKSRQGQVIVCESTKANWLNFKPLISFAGTRNKRYTEAIWTNIPTSYGHAQLSLFDSNKKVRHFCRGPRH